MEKVLRVLCGVVLKHFLFQRFLLSLSEVLLNLFALVFRVSFCFSISGPNKMLTFIVTPLFWAVIFLSFWAEVHYNSIYPEGGKQSFSSSAIKLRTSECLHLEQKLSSHMYYHTIVLSD